MREAATRSQRLSLTQRNLAIGNNFEDLKSIGVPSQSAGIAVQRRGYWSADRGLLNIAQCCLLSLVFSQYVVPN
jgi:hypothetical protein